MFFRTCQEVLATSHGGAAVRVLSGRCTTALLLFFRDEGLRVGEPKSQKWPVVIEPGVFDGPRCLQVAAAARPGGWLLPAVVTPPLWN